MQIGEAVGAVAIVASRLCMNCLLNYSEARKVLLALDMVHQSTGSQLLFRSDSLVVSTKYSKSIPCTLSQYVDSISCAWFIIKWY